MSARVYVLLDVTEDKVAQVVRALRGRDGVKMVDELEGLPNVIMMIQARDRQQLAELTVQALASTETMTEGMQLLPSRDGCSTCPPFGMGEYHTASRQPNLAWY